MPVRNASRLCCDGYSKKHPRSYPAGASQRPQPAHSYTTVRERLAVTSPPAVAKVGLRLRLLGCGRPLTRRGALSQLPLVLAPFPPTLEPEQPLVGPVDRQGKGEVVGLACEGGIAAEAPFVGVQAAEMLLRVQHLRDGAKSAERAAVRLGPANGRQLQQVVGHAVALA